MRFGRLGFRKTKRAGISYGFFITIFNKRLFADITVAPDSLLKILHCRRFTKTFQLEQRAPRAVYIGAEAEPVLAQTGTLILPCVVLVFFSAEFRLADYAL